MFQFDSKTTIFCPFLFLCDNFRHQYDSERDTIYISLRKEIPNYRGCYYNITTERIYYVLATRMQSIVQICSWKVEIKESRWKHATQGHYSEILKHLWIVAISGSLMNDIYQYTKKFSRILGRQAKSLLLVSLPLVPRSLSCVSRRTRISPKTQNTFTTDLLQTITTCFYSAPVKSAFALVVHTHKEADCVLRCSWWSIRLKEYPKNFVAKASKSTIFLQSQRKYL